MFLRIFRTALISLTFALGSGIAALAGPSPTTLAPIVHGNASLTVQGTGGRAMAYSIGDLERFPTYRLTTATPWRQEPATFEGVLLTDVLAASGLRDTPAIRVTAENDFTSDIPKAVWDSVPVLVATRVNGAPISRRERGPILFVVEDALYDEVAVVEERHLVWMAARIEPLR